MKVKMAFPHGFLACYVRSAEVRIIGGLAAVVGSLFISSAPIILEVSRGNPLYQEG